MSSSNKVSTLYPCLQHAPRPYDVAVAQPEVIEDRYDNDNVSSGKKPWNGNTVMTYRGSGSW